MSFELKYGDGATVRLEVPADAVLADGSLPRGAPLSDPAAAVAAALADPIEFPPFTEAIIPGDRVALSIEHGIPQIEAVIAGAVRCVLDGGASPNDLALVLAPESEEGRCHSITAHLPSSIRDIVTVSVHDPRDLSSLSYLATSRDDKPVYFNRTLFDADVVLPISTLRHEESLGYAGVHGGLFPTFSDEETRQRFRAPTGADWLEHGRRRREETDEAAWLLGVQLTLQIAPGSGNHILHVLAGESRAVAAQGRRLCEAAWLHTAPCRASLVVATIEGGPDQQTWGNFARALFAARQAVVDDGAIVLCTDLRCSPGPALQRLAHSHDEDDQLQRELRREHSDDAVSAALLAEALQHVRVYLLSGLEESVVEELGVGHVTHVEEVQRLSGTHRTCILLGNAQHAMLTAVED